MVLILSHIGFIFWFWAGYNVGKRRNNKSE